MKAHEIKPLMERVSKYNALSARHDALIGLLHKITDDDPQGPHGQGPFTGNTRETRRVREMEIWFTQTLGGAQAVNMNLSSLHIPASELGRFLEAQLAKQIEAVRAEMEAL